MAFNIAGVEDRRAWEDEMTDPIDNRAELDLRLHDPAFLEEIDLYSELMIVAASSTGALSSDAIDHALGLRNQRLADSH